MFAAGSYYYSVGATAPPTADSAPLSRRLQSATGPLYESINGCASR